MKMTAAQITASVLVFMMAVATTSSELCDYPPCSSVPFDVTYFYPNWEDCSKFWRCHNGQATRMLCPPEQVFDFYTFRCRRRPTRVSFQTSPVFSCEILLGGLDVLDRQS